ncbi:MAG: NAD(P)/FAD-dependent oxidoreductase [Candidatus Omnitrophota bacterium]|jgi:L-2-hydroxyglutarate oxidase LhgO
MEKVDITIIGAGVIGLAIAFELSKDGRSIVVVERHPKFGQETSSRNSEVIHAGMYYPSASLKAKTCVEGRRLLYAFCQEHAVPHKRIGKLIVATNNGEVNDLEDLYKQGLLNLVEGLEWLREAQVKNIEPNIKAVAAIYSAATGIIDSHGFMKELEACAFKRHVQLAYNTEVTGIVSNKEGFAVTVLDKAEGSFTYSSRVVINAAGLASEKVSAMAGIVSDEYKLKYCKGDYCRVHNNKGRFISHLVYPVPHKEDSGCLGVHATLDLAGSLRLGPDAEYVSSIDYTMSDRKCKDFYESSRSFLPFIDFADLAVDSAGMRPKLQGPGEGFRDFVIRNESDKGIPGFINLIGIESPGLTASLAIARMVKGMVT